MKIVSENDKQKVNTTLISSLSTQEKIQEWLVTYIANLMDVEKECVDVSSDFDSFGLGSVAIVSMTGELEEWLAYPSDPTLPYYYNSIIELSEFLADEYDANVVNNSDPDQEADTCRIFQLATA